MENIYKNSLLIELQKNNLKSEAEKEIHVSYKGKIVGIHRLDICVENKVIIELKTVEKLIKVHYCQIRSYLKATGVQIGILFNFASEKADFRRIQTS